jgi:hypothetical protein
MASFSKWLAESEQRAPDYAFDRWVSGAEKLKGDLNSMVGRSREEEGKLDKETDKKKKEVEAKEKEKKAAPKGKGEDEYDKLWNHLKKTAEEMSKERKPDEEPDDQGRKRPKGKSSA